MNPIDHFSKPFVQAGGKLLVSEDTLRSLLKSVKAFVFDWDGVFNMGIKSPHLPSPFSEPDSMGVNLLRYGYWLTHDQTLPFTAIITGATNETAQYFAQREHFHAIYYGYKNKREAWDHFCKKFELAPEEIAFVFDDVLDVSVAKMSGLRFLVKRRGNPLFNDFVQEKQLCEYMTAHNGGTYAVREICELLLATYGIYEQVLDSRIGFDLPYQQYWKARNAIETQLIGFETMGRKAV